MTVGSHLIGIERSRQIMKEGWTADHDTQHDGQELTYAAAAYLLAHEKPVTAQGLWPWEQRYWKPTPNDRIRELTKAGALIAAEIDRMLYDDLELSDRVIGTMIAKGDARAQAVIDAQAAYEANQ